MSEELHLNELDTIARLFGVIAFQAGEAILDIRYTCHPTYKEDGSPVTAADIKSDAIIRDCLERNLPDLPIVTEEAPTNATPTNASQFILVDPLDGTKEFIQGKDEFTVNIALIEGGRPVAGAVYAPALHQLYFGGTTAYKLDTRSNDRTLSFGKTHSIAVRSAPLKATRAVVSRSHLDAATTAWLECHGITDLRPSGSSLKFCMIAEGEADVYPRLAPTMEWDTAAGHAVLLAAGGAVTDLDGRPMQYGKPGYRNSAFVAWGNPSRFSK